MTIVDGFLIPAIVGGAAWLLYRSFVKNKGGCAGCGGCGGKANAKEDERLRRLS